MKNQKLTYVLLPLVLIIWGTIIWKVFNPSSTNVASQKNEVIAAPNIKEDLKAPMIKLSLNYPDPFLKNGNNYENKQEEVKEAKEEKKVLNRIVRWPIVNYKGSVKSRNSDTSLGLLTIGNRDHLIREKQLLQNILVVTICPDSIELEYQNDKKFFKRSGL